MAARLRRLKIAEISSVDRGAGEGVKVMLMKRAVDPSKETKPMTKNFTDIVKGLFGVRKSTAADEIAKANEALGASIDSILADTTLDATAKSDAIAKSLDQHAEHLNGTIPAAIEKALSDAGFSASDFKKGTDMTIDVKKALGLPADATDEQVTKALEEAALGQKIAKMSGKHSGFMNNDKAKMPTGGKSAFANMTDDQRDKHMSDNPVSGDNDADDTKKGLSDEEFSKRFAADPQVIDMRKRLDEMTKDKEITAVRKAWSADGLTEPQMDVVQKVWEVSSDKAPVEAMVKQLAAANAQAREAGIFKELGGTGNGGGATPHEEITAKAHELRKADPTLTFEQAYAKAYSDPANESIAKRDVLERRAAIRA